MTVHAETTDADAAHDNSPAVVAKTADTDDGKVFTPASNPGAVVVGVLLGVALLGLAAIATRDLLIHVGWVSSDEWLAAAARWIAHLSWATWMWPTAIASIVVGLWLLWLALRPRRKSYVSVAGFEVLWTRRGDIARRVSTAVSSVSGVQHASTVVGRRRAKVSVIADNDLLDPAAVQRTVDGVLSGVDLPLRAKISVQQRRNGRRKENNDE